MTTLTTLKEMIDQRNVKITDETDTLILAEDEDGEQICVFKIPILKFDVERLKEITSTLNIHDIKHGIVVYIHSATAPAKKCVREIEHEAPNKIELFTEKELQFNITKHILVPQHIKLSAKDSEDYKKKYGSKIPIILKTDPVSRFYNYKKGDIIKVIRGEFVTHRIVR